MEATQRNMHNVRIFLFFFVASAVNFLQAQQSDYPFLDPDLSIEERVEDLASRLTLEEKAAQLRYNAPAIPRLNIPEYNWWNECLHGIARAGRATIFPQAIGMAATFDTDLMNRVGMAIAEEARAKYNVSVANGYRGIFRGLTFWTPNVNIFRDPRWGRGQETYGEDPYLTSRIGVAFVKGLQGTHPKYIKAAGCAKHFAVHSGPEELRHEFNATVSQKDLWETYLPAFEALVKEAKVEGVMGAYNRTNGKPCCAHPYLMTEVLRKKWGFDGYFTSDCWAIQDFYQGHHIAANVDEANALALSEGCNLNCGDSYDSLLQSVENGLVTEADIDKNVKQLLKTRFRLGLFDPVEDVPFNTIGPEVIHQESHVTLSREVASKSFVLLKNKDNLLPLKKDLESIYVVGPTATHMQALLANYYGVSEDMTTFLEGVVAKVSPQTSVQYSQGAMLDVPNNNPIDWYSGTAAGVDVTIAFVGLSQLIEGEEGESIASQHKGDRKEIRLPQNQIDFLKVIRENAKKLVVVMTGGSAIACPEVYEMADALVFAWYPGEQGGIAMGDLLFGDVNPSGKLPVTFPNSVDDLPPYDDYGMKNRTYRYIETVPLFPFGFGLSYSTFEFANLKLDNNRIRSGSTIQISVEVTNKGTLAGEEVVQLYLKDLEASTTVPIQSLKGFKRVSLSPGETKTIAFDITPEMMEMVTDRGERVIEKGQFQVFIGGTSPGSRSIELGATPPVSQIFQVR